LNALVGSERIGALLRKEKDETSPPKLFLGGSSNSPHSSFAKFEVFYFQNLQPSRWSLNRKNRPRKKMFSRGQN
jgi:hypothetical protein